MIPNKSNTNSGCNNTSSNCVIWQGPDLTCVNICNGDTISDVVAKLAEQLCECCGLTADANGGQLRRSGVSIDIRTVNQLCLESDYGKANNIQILLNNIIDKLCKSTGQSEVDVCSCSIILPECLRDKAKNYLNTTDSISTMVLHDPNTNKGYAHFLAEQICNNATAINDVNRSFQSLNGRVVALENRANKKVIATLPPIKIDVGGTGRAQSVESAIVATNTYLAEYAKVMGSQGQINTAISVAPELGGRSKLSGSGTMSAIRNWISLPRNLAQSFQNLWITTNDIRNAVESMKETVANPLCGDITFDVKGTVEKSPTGQVSGISLDFSDSSIPSVYNDCNSKGTKITITDSSLNQKIYYVDVSGVWQNSNQAYRITTDKMGNLDLGSNYSVRVEFCFSNGDNQCSEIQNFTINNELSCPTLTIGTVTATSIPFTVSDFRFPANKGYTVTVELKTNSGSLLDSRSYTTFSTNITGVFNNLKPNTQYKVNTIISKSGITDKSDCPEQLVSTSAPECSTILFTPASASWKTSETHLQSGANTLEIATYNDGAAQTKWQMGFDDTNAPIVVQASTTGVTGWNHKGNFINNELPTNPLTITGLTGSPVGPTGIGRTDLESGWKYIGTIKDPMNQVFYAYASINTTTHTVNQVVFACNCSGIYLDTDQPVFYCPDKNPITIKINAVGFTADSGEYTWNIATQPTHGSLSFRPGSPTKDYVEYAYAPGTADMVGDGFTVTLTNDCGTTVGHQWISILPANRIPWTDTEVIVFFDTNSMTTADALKIKGSFDTIRSNFAGTKPNFSYVAVDGPTSGDYLKHVKACVENTGGSNPTAAFTAARPASISVPAAGTWWTNVMSSGATRPGYWTSGKAALPTSVHVISFVSQVSSHGTYGAATVPSPAAWGGQPTTSSGVGTDRYEEDFDAIIDMTSSAAPTSAWGIACQAMSSFPWLSGSIPFTVSQVVVPILNDTVGPTAATALQTAAAMQGETLLKLPEISGLKLGLEKFRWDNTTGINLASYLQDGTASTNIPYSGTTAVVGNTITGLKEVSGFFKPALHAYIENGIDFAVSTNSDITTYFRGMFGLLPTSSAGEPISVGAILMKNGIISDEYAPADPATNTAVNACSEATNPAKTFEIYNENGVEFDPDHRAYSSLTGAVNGQSEYELINGRWYAGDGGAGRQRAQYSTSHPHWTGAGAC
jgi:hypothetical protein